MKDDVRAQGLSGRMQEPSVRVQEPSVRVQEPSIRVQEPSVRVQEPSVRVQGLSLRVQDKILLHDIDLTLPEGGVHLILGPNGAGKTLLLRCLAGVLRPSAGTIRMGSGQDAAKTLSWTPLSSALPFPFTVHELVLMGRYPWHQGFPGPGDRQATDQALKRVGMSRFFDRVYNSLSRGEQTRVDIARAIASPAPILLLDEPFANLDIDASLHMIQLFHELAREGRTLILSHHDLYSARDLATHLVFLKEGRLIASGPSPGNFTPALIRETYAVEARMQEEFIRFQLLRPNS